MDFREIMDKLIDISSLTDKQKIGDEYEDAREWIHTDLKTARDVEVACYHEAGHWAVAVIEAEQLGLSPDQIKPTGPSIKYDDAEKQYDPTSTGLRLGADCNWRPTSNEDVESLARIAVAGGEAVLCFYGPAEPRGDKDDLPRFKRVCREARNWLGSDIGPPHTYLEDAKEKVREHFNNPEFKKTVETKAIEIKSEIFGSVFA